MGRPKGSKNKKTLEKMKKTSAAAGGAEADGGGEKKRGRGRPPKKKNTTTFKTKKSANKTQKVVVKSVNSSSSISKKKKKRGRPPKTPNTKTTTISAAPEKGVVIRKEFELITTAEKNRLDRGATGARGRGRGRGRGGGRGRGRPPALPKDGVLKRLVLQSKGVEKKRGRGRSPKSAQTTTEKRKPGRPRKEPSSAAPVAILPKKSPGRPRKIPARVMPPQQQKKQSRSVPQSTQTTEKRKPGRPRKEPSSAAPVAILPKKSPGRPRKNPARVMPPQQQKKQSRSRDVNLHALESFPTMEINENVSRAMTLTMGLPYAEKFVSRNGAFKPAVRKTPPPPSFGEVIETPSKRGRGRPPKEKSVETTTTTNETRQKPHQGIGRPPSAPVRTTTTTTTATTTINAKATTTTTAAQSRWRLDYHRIVVTGGTRGIGRACAEEFLGLGAKVFVCGRTQKSVNVAVSEMRKKFGVNKVSGIDADITTKEGRSKVLLMCDEFFGANSFDVLVNNAGWNNRQAITAQTAEDFQQIMDVNFAAPYFMCVASAERLYRSSKNPSVINVSSVAGLSSTGSGVAYAASKAALAQLTKTLACEWAPQVRSNCVAPWVTKTEMLAKALKANANSLRKAEKSTPLGRAAEVTDIAAAVAFLAMSCSRYINGQIIAVDGGLLCEAHQGDCARVGPLAR
ncbi:unnamed protein product [Bathycoccus prasinos]